MFSSAHAALQYAFRISNNPVVKMSSVKPPEGGSPSELSPHDKHAQAAMIISIVSKAVDPVGMNYLQAYYGYELRGGDNAAKVAQSLFRAVMAGLPTGMHSTKGIGRLIGLYFGADCKAVQVREIQKALNCTSQRRYYEYRDGVYGILDAVAKRAENAAHRALEDAGLIT